MTKQEALKKRPCCNCTHYEMYQIVDHVYSPCYEGDKDGNDYHSGFKLTTKSYNDG